ncbi:Serine/threonine-protein kinase PrkC [Gemmata sp. SH-PL17]|uniref:protein kinase family protein n=1 Tax=Gemmata sp. SH-PL17 TaxID=1630693 RepID=UPI00078C32A1|nr:protein kinase family protein [Gemmata sp. SH-PL17]AMV23526.1 Serine/threonine-protein kinase PrkC [Gemmata sp. SH-PL17]
MASWNFPVAPPKQPTLPADGEVIVHNNHQYRLGQEIAEGTFARVFQCVDEWGNNLAAKVLIPRNQSYAEVRDNWHRELMNLITFRHPNITYVHEAFEYRNTFYIIVERCDLTLEKFITFSDVEGEAWLPYIARDILQGLHFIHGEQYVHKDLHAKNILVTRVNNRIEPEAAPDLVFKISDFGISKLEAEIRAFGTVMAQWMLPPECLAPVQFGQVGKHTDIYHTGLLLLSLLTKTDQRFTHEQIVNGVPSSRAKQLPSPYGPIIAKALQCHTHLRIPSALQFWKELRDARSWS